MGCCSPRGKDIKKRRYDDEINSDQEIEDEEENTNDGKIIKQSKLLI